MLLYAAGFFWTLSYDTIYAHQDKEDDTLIGVKSTALKLGPATKKWLLWFDLAMLALLIAAGAQAGMGWLYYVAVLGVAVHLKWQEFDVDLDDPKDCLIQVPQQPLHRMDPAGRHRARAPMVMTVVVTQRAANRVDAQSRPVTCLRPRCPTCPRLLPDR